jgi:hypothetical protein
VLNGAACIVVATPPRHATSLEAGASLWERPLDLPSRDLFHGPWGAEHAPDPDAVYRLVERKHSGVNLGLDVVDPDGREWSVKQPFPGGMSDEGPVEVVVSRLLSAVGYHQPPVYYLSTFTLEDDWGRHTEIGGRFRLDLDTLDSEGSWRWHENPFVGTPPFEGLLVLLMMFNSTDLKDSNNTLYEWEGGEGVEWWYAVRDLGAALGDTPHFGTRKGDIDAFERHPFIRGVVNGYVEFEYRAWYRPFVRDRITPASVVWACNLLGRLSDRQWHDAFRAGGFEPPVAARFIAKLREKIRRGQALAR